MSIRADFYLLSTPSIEASQDFVCRLIEKIYKQGHRFYIHTTDHTSAKQLDNLLWTFNDISFIPHALCDASSNTTQDTTILIGFDNNAKISGEILLNLSMHVPEFSSQFQRIIEVVPQQAESQQLGRERFKIYRSRGCEIFTHDLRKT